MAAVREQLEKNIGLMVIAIVLVFAGGGMVTIIPLFYQSNLIRPVEGLQPHNSLQLAGMDLYVKEGCYGCHSQMIRALRAETERYGHYSLAGEFVYDRPFQWGSKRTGPDLQRVGGRFSDQWQREHLIDPRSLVPDSIMPGYPWLAERALDGELVQRKMRTLRSLGHPYTDEDIDAAPAGLEGKTELDAIVAYLQNLGTAVTRSGNPARPRKAAAPPAADGMPSEVRAETAPAEDGSATAAGDGAGAKGDAVAGEAVYTLACVVCHSTGVAGAPKTGDATAWEPRLAKGIDGLVQSAINGLGAMPPRGGNASLSDEQVRAAIEFMLPAGAAQ
jgi:cytochrome c oxidase cbb3-type subunit 2